MFEKEAEKRLPQAKIDYYNSFQCKPNEVPAIEIVRFGSGYTKGFKDGAEFGYNKAKEEMQKNGLALQSDMDKTIEQNIALKKELNKANEWHDLRKNPNDLPKECKGKLYLVNIYSDSQLKFEYAEYTPTVCLWSSEWKRFEILELTVGSSIVNIRNVIAWKEIVLPGLKESR